MRLLLADGDPLLVAELRQTLPEHGLEIAGDTQEPSMILPLIDQTRPDCVLLDLQMPATGIQCLAAIRERGFALKVVIFSDIDDAGVVATAFAGGVDAYVLKAGCPHDRLAVFLRRLTEGAIFEPLDLHPREGEPPRRARAEVLAHTRPGERRGPSEQPSSP